MAIRNHDVPGVVGRIGTILGEHSINIANFALGRGTETQRSSRMSARVPQGQALAVVQIDVAGAGDAAAAVEALKAVEAIASVRMVELGKS